MAKFFAFAVAFLAISVASAQEDACDMTQESIQADLMKCLAQNPSLMLQVIENMKNPSSMAQIDFMCRNKVDLVDVVLCLEKMMTGCVSSEYQDLLTLLPSRDKMLDAVQFLCNNRNELTEGDSCMQSSVQDLMQCITGKAQSLQGFADSGLTKEALQGAICRVVRMEESCLAANHGTCSQSFIKLEMTFLEKLFPMNGCPVVTVEQDSKNPFGDFVIHGEPLRFQPQDEAEYNIVKK